MSRLARQPRITARGLRLWNDISGYLDPDPENLGPAACSLITRHARTHHRLAEMGCNGTLTATDERLGEYLEDRIRALAAQLRINGRPVAVKFSGDPRGCTVKLLLGRGNTFGGDSEGWGVL